MAIKYLKEQETQEVIDKGGLTLVNVFATWCGPCQMLAPILEEVSNSVEVIKIDVDQEREFARKLGVKGVPTTFVYKNGKVVQHFSGYMPKEAIEQTIAPFK